MRKAQRIFSYSRSGQTLYRIDMYVRDFEGSRKRYREMGFSTIQEAQQAVDLKLSQRFAPPSKKHKPLTVREAWEAYNEGATERGVPSSHGRFSHLDRHLGKKLVVDLHPGLIDSYRGKRRKEHRVIEKRDPKTGKLRMMPRLRGGKRTYPTDMELDHEVTLLQAVINHAVRCRSVPSNPLKGVKLLKPDNVRNSVVSEKDFKELVQAADDWLKPILVVAYDTGMRRGEILSLCWDRIDLSARHIRLRADDTKAKQARIVYLTDRVVASLKAMPQSRTGKVFCRRPKGKKRLPPGHGFRTGFVRAKKKAGLDHIWFHDLRRSFVTNARKRGVPESVVMKMSGHRTRSVFTRYNIIDDEDLRAAVGRIQAGQTL